MVVIAALAALIGGLVAVLINWLPESASEEMDRIVFTYWFATIICIGIFALVAAVIVYAVWTFRVQPDDDTDGPPIHGHTGLEIAWTVVPAVLVIAIGIVSAVVLSQNADAGRDPLQVRVFAQQFAWRFAYERDVRSEELVLPVDRGVEFTLESADVIHSLWIPEMGQKQDVVPGVTQKIVITPTRTGRFTLDLHRALRPRPLDDARARPRARAGGVRARGSTSRRRRARTDRVAAAVRVPAAAVRGSSGEATFASAGCGGCHTLSAAGTDSQIGPSLDDVGAAAEQAGMPVDEFVRQSIVDPDAVIAPEYQPGVMPKDFAQSLSPEELDALVAYVSGEEESE